MEYRVVKYGDGWYVERAKEEGVWEIICACSSQNEAQERIKREEENA